VKNPRYKPGKKCKAWYLLFLLFILPIGLIC
jgi:hypothetical protein